MKWELRLGDALKPGGLDTLPDWSVDHTIADPPYEDEVHTKGRRLLAGSFAERAAPGDKTITRPISYPPITADERRLAAQHIARVTRRWILIFCQVEGAHLWRAALEDAGAEYVRTGSWHKTDAQPQLSGDRPGQGWEAIVIAHSARAAGGSAAALPLLQGLDRQHAGRMRWNGGGHCAKWSGSSRDTGGDLTRRKWIDGQKPRWLIDDLIAKFTDTGDLILDPCAGSGTTVISAVKAGRRALAWERVAEHHQMALRRIEQELGNG